MTPPEAVAYLQRFSYKPNFTFLFYSEPPARIVAYIKARVPDATTSRAEFITVQTTQHLDFGLFGLFGKQAEECLTTWLSGQVEAFERHEAAEWLKRDGDQVQNPHAESP